MAVPNEWLAFLREQYPAGSRVRLRQMGSGEPQMGEMEVRM